MYTQSGGKIQRKAKVIKVSSLEKWAIILAIFYF